MTDQSSMFVCRFWIDGVPETKGSWRAIGGGKMKRDNPREKAWSDAVGWAAKAKMIGRKPYDGHVAVTADFMVPPIVGTKNKRDIDKLVRSVLDAITGIVIVDDELVYKLCSTKTHTSSGMHGAMVTVLRAERIHYATREITEPERTT